ncbi:MAG: dUTP diphosphatase [Actinobacteria bacterium]|nr:dUTP diphosphatase [Actinomycetota bacterium]
MSGAATDGASAVPAHAPLAVKRLHPQAILPRRAYQGDAGLDLHATEAVTLEPGARASVGTGIAVAIPEGQGGLVLPRSGLAARSGIALVNAPGLIDAGYRGEIRVLLLNTDRETPCEIAVGDRIAQLVLVKLELPATVEVDELPASERGEGGFGSSGS